VAQQRVIIRGMIPPCQCPEPPRIIEPDAFSTLEDKIEMIVFARRIIHVANSQGTGHSKVDQQPTGFAQLNQQVFRTPPAAGNLAPLGLEYIFLHRPAKAGISNHKPFDTTAGKGRLYAAQGGFDFWQLRQSLSLASLLRQLR
jgi:hypothetical protein